MYTAQENWMFDLSSRIREDVFDVYSAGYKKFFTYELGEYDRVLNALKSAPIADERSRRIAETWEAFFRFTLDQGPRPEIAYKDTDLMDIYDVLETYDEI